MKPNYQTANWMPRQFLVTRLLQQQITVDKCVRSFVRSLVHSVGTNSSIQRSSRLLPMLLLLLLSSLSLINFVALGQGL